ncbi:MAG: choice-of-anchor I family protein [Planctomycetota bacterium]
MCSRAPVAVTVVTSLFGVVATHAASTHRSAEAPTSETAVPIAIDLIGRYKTERSGESAAEISAFDPESRRLFVTNAADNAIEILNLADPTLPTLIRSIDLTPFGAGVNSVATSDGLVAVAVEAERTRDPGGVAMFDVDGRHLHTFEAGHLPDMVTFTPDARWLLAANEGEPSDNYKTDPPGSVTVIRLPENRTLLPYAEVRKAGFERWDNAGAPDGVRVFGPGASVSQDLEPEYIAVAPDSTTAFVVCQENNALAILDIESAEITSLVGLGSKDHALPTNGLDASDRDDGIQITPRPVFGMRQPDAIAAFGWDDGVYLVTADEGDARSYDGYGEEARVKDLKLDPQRFPNAEGLQADESLGRLKVTTAQGDVDGDGDFDELYAFGARGISVFDASGRPVMDSGDAIERLIAQRAPAVFNAAHDRSDAVDSRSDDKGPEPEAIAVSRIGERVIAFCGLERVGGVVAFDVSDPASGWRSGRVVGYGTSRRLGFGAGAGGDGLGDSGPEGIIVIEPEDSPDGTRLLVVTHEVSGSVAVYRVTEGS